MFTGETAARVSSCCCVGTAILGQACDLGKIEGCDFQLPGSISTEYIDCLRNLRNLWMLATLAHRLRAILAAPNYG